MAHSDAELIKRTLDGDETAFGFLVDKYKGAVHALAYRKLGDFHTAEEITQDTFLKAYQKLATLKDWSHFPGWLYTIAARFCLMWQRQKRLPTQSLDSVETGEIDSLAYAKYTDERVHQEVRDALECLPESERTVLTLYYLGGLTCEEIGRFIGTSRGAVRDRLYRARCRLKEEMIDMMQETLGTFQLPPTLTQRIMEQIRYVKPTAASDGKPLAPWIAATTVAVMALFIGVGLMRTQRFQRPYSLDALESATMIELTDAPIIDLPIQKQSTANRVGQSNAGNAGNGNLSSGDVLALAADAQGDKKSGEIVWAPTNGPYGGVIWSLLAAPEGILYAGASGGAVFRSEDRGNSWTQLNIGLTSRDVRALAVLGNSLYAGTEWDGVFRSDDGGNSWMSVGLRTSVVQSVIQSLAVMGTTLYAGTWGGGVFRSDDGGDSWMPINAGLTHPFVQSLVVMGTTLYGGTSGGASFVWGTEATLGPKSTQD